MLASFQLGGDAVNQRLSFGGRALAVGVRGRGVGDEDVADFDLLEILMMRLVKRRNRRRAGMRLGNQMGDEGLGQRVLLHQPQMRLKARILVQALGAGGCIQREDVSVLFGDGALVGLGLLPHLVRQPGDQSVKLARGDVGGPDRHDDGAGRGGRGGRSCRRRGLGAKGKDENRKGRCGRHGQTAGKGADAHLPIEAWKRGRVGGWAQRRGD